MHERHHFKYITEIYSKHSCVNKYNLLAFIVWYERDMLLVHIWKTHIFDLKKNTRAHKHIYIWQHVIAESCICIRAIKQRKRRTQVNICVVLVCDHVNICSSTYRGMLKRFSRNCGVQLSHTHTYTDAQP